MRKNSFILICLSALVLLGCATTDLSKKNVGVVIQSDNLTARLSKVNCGVIKLDSASTVKKAPQLAGSSTTTTTSVVSDMPLALIAEIAAPTYGGLTLRATHVAVQGTLAYVSYNYEGDKYVGAIDVIDITDPTKPKLVQSAIFPDTDISSLCYANGYLYLAGAKDSYSDNGTGPAVLMKMKLISNNLSDDIQLTGMTGYVGTDVKTADNYVYAVSGSNGVVGAYASSDNKLQASLSLSDLRAVGVNNGQVIAFQNGTINALNPATLTKISSFPTSTDVAQAKRTIDFYSNSVLTAEGTHGVGVYNLSTGARINTIPLATVTDPTINVSEVVSNAVSVNNEHIFVANGAAGVTVHKIVSNKIDNLVDFGNLVLAGSANFVISSNGYVFVADGFGGLKILKLLSVDPSTGQSTTIDCTQYPTYTGGNWMNVNSGDTFSYNGSASLSGINVNSSLTWCGILGVSDQLNINSGGTFYMKGSLSFGSSGKSLMINANSKLKIEGSLVIYGNLTLNSGATLEFAGVGSSITVYGSVTKGTNVTITGTHTDTFNSLK
jgi:hypothetical protein